MKKYERYMKYSYDRLDHFVTVFLGRAWEGFAMTGRKRSGFLFPSICLHGLSFFTLVSLTLVEQLLSLLRR